jgi:hypothetical protein
MWRGDDSIRNNTLLGDERIRGVFHSSLSLRLRQHRFGVGLKDGDHVNRANVCLVFGSFVRTKIAPIAFRSQFGNPLLSFPVCAKFRDFPR